MKTRNAAVAGAFYPASKEELESMLNEFLKNIPGINIKEPKALIVPHAGYVYSGQVAAYAYSLLKNSKKQKIILLGPSHTAYFNDVAADVNDYWETPLGKVKIMQNNFPKLEEAHINEHCLEVQIPFLQKTLKDFEILPLVVGDINPKEISKKIIPLLDDNTLLIISSDLSHFHDYDTAVSLDKNTIKAIQNLDCNKAETEADACGKIPILTVIDIAKKLKWKCKLLNYKNSGDVIGDKTRVVGYASFVLY
ncbi:MAG: AmmeMemoRadiSam system protein B [Nanoarchaeota archaeon]|nr:AmmeMemoRadiSam system protein B [Nanoarchaeota archaeon]